jgi:subtilisin family serine protease
LRAPTRLVIAVMACCLVAGVARPAGATAPVSRDQLPSVASSPPNGPRFAPGEVLVRFKQGRAPVQAADVNARSMQALAVRGWKLVRLEANETVGQAIARLQADPAVAEVTANHVYHDLAIPNDSLFGRQWGLQNTGQTINGVAGTAGADISAPSAWNVTTGSDTVIVGVVDSGVAATHPDLAPNVILGSNFVGDRTTSDTHDVLGHGTHVAGIIGAADNDGYGVTGVSPHVTILPLRALDDTGSGYTSDIADAFAYGAAHGAKVISASLGGSDPDPVLAQAIADNPNTLFVVAAGNATSNNDATATYPCNYTSANLICVAASDQKDQLASFSNYGATSVDLAAPGVNIASTFIPDVAGYGGTGYALADSPDGGYTNNADTWAESATTIDPAGKTNCNLSYKLRARLAPNDVLTAETASSSAPDTWSAVDTFGNAAGATTNGIYTSRAVPVSPDGSVFNVRFHLVSDGSGTEDGVYVDNVAVVCGGSTIYGPDLFAGSLTGYTTGGTGNNWATTNVAGKWVYMSGTSMATPFVSGTAALIWAYQPSATAAHVKNVILGSVDPKPAFAGKTVSGGRLNAARALQDVADVTAPTGSVFTGAGIANAFQLSKSFILGWKAVDSGTGVLSYDVRYEGARFNSGFNPWRTWLSGFTGTSATFSSAPGNTFCFQVRARDKALNLSAWSASRCTAFPVNDTALTAGGGWLRLKSSLRYLGTFSYSKTRGASLILKGVQYKHLYLIVTVCPGCGVVQVFRGSKLIGSYSLNASSTSYKHQIPVSRLSSVSGPTTITIKGSTSGLPVEIEGLGVSRL